MVQLLTSTVGKKYLMGLSGLVWVGFVFAHMAGNLLIFIGPEAYNLYGHALTSGYFIYAAEAVLILALVTHVICGVSLTLENKRARPTSYAASGSRHKSASLASKTMAIHGTIILIFLITHLVTFKFGPVYMANIDGLMVRDLHRLMVEIFHQPIYVVSYAICLLLLGLHLSHGVGSIFQSFGLLHPAYQGLIEKIKWTYSLVVVAGFLSQPIYIFLFV